MWAIIIAFFGWLEGAEMVMILTFLAILIAGGMLFHGWYTGREGVGEAPKPLLERIRRKGT